MFHLASLLAGVSGTAVSVEENGRRGKRQIRSGQQRVAATSGWEWTRSLEL